MKRMAWGLAALAVTAMAMPADADAQNRRTRERLEEIESQLRDLQGAVYGADRQGAPISFEGANPDGPSTPLVLGPGASQEMGLRLSGLEAEVQRLTGEIERLGYAVQQQNTRMNRLVQLLYPDTQDQITLGLMGQGDAIASAPYPEGTTEAQPADRPVDLVGGSRPSSSLPGYADAGEAYAAGRSALFAGRFPEAERAFLALVENYPDSDEYDDGLFLLAETYMAQGDLKSAAQSYLDFIRTVKDKPDHPKVAEAHLKLGQAFVGLKRPDQACTIWRRAVQYYPKMDGDLLSEINGARRENDCG
ncbi:MAG: tetratricopeptide repeat protein, partial [Pseudomonadota bacterium]